MDVAAVAAQDSEILFLDMDHILHVCFGACAFHERLVKNVFFCWQKKRSLSAKLDCIAPRTIRDRLLEYLSKEAGVQESYLVKLPFKRQQLSDYLLVDRSTMTTELYQMQREGLICVKKNTIRLIESSVRIEVKKRKSSMEQKMRVSIPEGETRIFSIDKLLDFLAAGRKTAGLVQLRVGHPTRLR